MGTLASWSSEQERIICNLKQRVIVNKTEKHPPFQRSRLLRCRLSPCSVVGRVTQEEKQQAGHQRVKVTESGVLGTD